MGFVILPHFRVQQPLTPLAAAYRKDIETPGITLCKLLLVTFVVTVQKTNNMIYIHITLFLNDLLFYFIVQEKVNGMYLLLRERVVMEMETCQLLMLQKRGLQN